MIIVILSGILLAGRWYISANPATLVKVLKWTLIGTILTAIMFFIVSGRFSLAFATVPALLPWLMRLRQAVRLAKSFNHMSKKASNSKSGQTSRITTKYLDMKLDHDTGILSGQVIHGKFYGQNLSDLSDQHLVQLFDELELYDIESIQILLSYVSRERKDWRAHSKKSYKNEENGPMTEKEAYDILGLELGVPEKDILNAHKQLIFHLHPDKGGSTFLASKVNQAKDTLLNKNK